MSCDILPTESDISGRHYRCNVLPLLRKRWDLVIAHPPCTYIATAGGHYLRDNLGHYARKLPLETGEVRRRLMREASNFFRRILEARSPRIAVENPVPLRCAVEIIGRSYDQRFRTGQFGEERDKEICLWLSGLPPLVPTHVVDRDDLFLP
ncbi:MAG: hypothetical protein OXJ64_15045, partial [Boseongicola sp.]|nr:hypothetical protein [Boseongicola sp.]